MGTRRPGRRADEEAVDPTAPEPEVHVLRSFGLGGAAENCEILDTPGAVTVSRKVLPSRSAAWL